jgi:hypothetical protein
MSNFPNGFRNGIAIQGLPILNTYAGNIFWADSGAGSNGNPGSYVLPFGSIEYAKTKCTANNGDIIMAKPGHVETVTAAGGLDLDVAGITVVFLGNGSNQAYVNFTTAVTADMDIDADDITLINPRFVAGIDALTGPIDVNADNFTIVNGQYEDATDIDTTDCIVATSGAIGLAIKGWRYVPGNEGGTQKQSNIQLNGVDNAILEDIDIAGDFATGAIENVTDEVLNIRLRDIDINNTNSSPTPGIVLDANATGIARNVKIRVASGTTYVSSVGKISWGEGCEGFSTDGYAGDPIGTALASGLEGKIDVIDAYHDVATADAATNAVMSDVIGNKTDAAVGAATTDKSLMGYIKGILTDTGTTIPATLAAIPQCIVKTGGTVENATTDDLFTISGGPVRCKITGLVTTIIGGAASVKLQITTDAPAATIDLNAGAVDIDSDAVGTIYQNIGSTSTFTPSASLGGIITDPVTVEEVEFVLTPGTVKLHSTAAQTGAISWYMTYTPMSPLSVVTAAA